MLGLPPEEMIGKGPLDWVSPDDLPMMEQARDTRLSGNQTSYDIRLLQKDGQLRPVWITGVPRLQKGEIIGSIAVITDLTERLQAEEARQKHEAELASIFRAFPIGIGKTIQRVIEQVNDRFCQMTGYAREELIGQSARIVYPSEEEYTRIGQEKYHLMNTSKDGIGSIEAQMRRKDGEIIDVLLGSSYLDTAHLEKGVTFTVQDITARKRAENHLEQQTKNLSTLHTLAQEITASLDLPNIYLAAHKAAFHLMPGEIFVISLLDETRQEIEDVYLWDHDRRWPGGRYPAGHDLPGYIITHAQPLRVHQWDATYDHLTGAETFGDQEKQPQSLLAVPMHRAGGTCFGMMSIQAYAPHLYTLEHEQLLLTLASQVAKAVENTQLYLRVQQELAERKLAEEEIRYQANLLANVSDAIVSTDLTFHVKSWNQAAERLYGWKAEEMLGKVTHEVVPTSFIDIDFETVFTRVLQTGSWEGNLSQQSRDGRAHFFLCSCTLLHDSASKPTGYVFVNREITESIKHQREMEAIVQVSAALRNATRRAEMIPVILDQLDALFGAEATAFTAPDYKTDEIVVEMARGVLAEALRARLPLGEGVSGQVIATQTSYLNNDALTESMIPGSEELGEHHAVACVPLVAHEQTIGTLWLARKHPLAENDLKILAAVADIAANAIHRAGLFEQTQQQLERLAILHAMDTAIASSFDLRPTLYILLEQIQSRLKVAAADVYLYNAHTLTLEFTAGSGFQNPAIKHTRLHLGEGCTGQTALEHRLTTFPDFQTYLAEHPTPTHRLLQAEGFTTYYGLPLLSKGQVKGVLELFYHTPFAADDNWLEFLETLGRQVAIAMDNIEMLESVQRSKLELELAYDATIEGWSRALDLRDKETEGHSQRVTKLTLKLAHQMGVAEEEIVHIRRGALLHDIGKMGIPDAILLKPGSLSETEWEMMRKHPEFAYEMLSPIAYLKPALDIPHYHHEKWDGTGYPYGLSGEQIPLPSRIFALADVWDALTSNRPYRDAWTAEKTYAHIRAQAGRHFDPQVVSVFLARRL
jgi:PAS domain S-box-containing protein/putative nucleotidyltransferase with HDIG domain